MRRKDREMKETSDIEAVLKEAVVCRLGLSCDDVPYIVPMTFGYSDGCLYMHSAKEGKKIDMIKKNNRVCFEVEAGYEIVEADKACAWSMKYKSIIGFGKASFIDNFDEKVKALNAIMSKHSSRGPYTYGEKEVNAVTVIKVEIESMTGKKSG